MITKIFSYDAGKYKDNNPAIYYFYANVVYSSFEKLSDFVPWWHKNHNHKVTNLSAALLWQAETQRYRKANKNC
ncbi:MAG: hypothetical protein JXB00_07085 [Bacteroidales bacterium]|nr:hypothetical protein [Bacteroidales bacterium]